MFATVVRVTLKDEAAARQGLADQIVPTVKSQPGFVAGYWLAPKDGKGMSIVLWEDEASARAAAKVVRETPADAPVTIDAANVREVIESA